MTQITNLLEDAKSLVDWAPAKCLLDLNGIKIRLGKYGAGKQGAVEQHTVDEFLVLLSGVIDVKIDDTTQRMTKNDCAIISAGTIHSVKAVEEATMLVVRWMPS